MRKTTLLVLSSLLLLSCKPKTISVEPLSYWADTSGMALFEVKKIEGNEFSISSSLGSLKGTLTKNSIRGVTDLNDSFSLEILGDSAKYSILGITIDYTKVTKLKYDSLGKLLTSN